MLIVIYCAVLHWDVNSLSGGRFFITSSMENRILDKSLGVERLGTKLMALYVDSSPACI